jgi:NAD(P)-dependent dehydrogenase (short-subunit alcohol dehydrogenase family)
MKRFTDKVALVTGGNSGMRRSNCHPLTVEPLKKIVLRPISSSRRPWPPEDYRGEKQKV